MTIKKSILAPILIGFGVAVLLFLGNPLGPLLFAFGLLTLNSNVFLVIPSIPIQIC